MRDPELARTVVNVDAESGTSETPSTCGIEVCISDISAMPDWPIVM